MARNRRTENRILETVTGREAAEREIRERSACFNDCNGENRMVVVESKLEAWDNEGSGEFYLAVCLNSNSAQSNEAEIYEIQTCW
jgi:hypothetical protein